MIESFVENLGGLLPFGFSFTAGMVTTVTPCAVAMLPAYIALYLGSQEKGYWAESVYKRIARALILSIVVTLAFVLLFGAAGAVLTAGGDSLNSIIPWVAVVIGVILVLMGIFFLFGGHLYINFTARLANRIGAGKAVGVKGFFIFGIAYALAALSCNLPVFLVVVVTSITEKGYASGLLQFVYYALGMGFIMMLITLASALFKETANRWLRRVVPVVARLNGLLLILAGVYIIYYWFVKGDILG
ncbi:MAG: cytochrome c biogenesis protein CcdA [Chloroflexi bacterium]|jgi:cytochrome c-type biogenesis protein|nr:cytochrome c biogenesis protein CcdA [Chloroflexota bacterium]